MEDKSLLGSALFQHFWHKKLVERSRKGQRVTFDTKVEHREYEGLNREMYYQERLSISR